MYFYKGINGFFNINGNALTPGRYMLRVTKDKSTVSLFSTLKGTQILTWIEVTNLQKGDGSYYVDLEELLKEMKDFFTPPHKGAVPADWYQTTIGSISNEVHQNPDGTYYIFNFGKGGSAADINIGNAQVGRFDGLGSNVTFSPTIGNIYGNHEIGFKFKKLGSSGGSYHGLLTRTNGVNYFQIPIFNSTNKLSLYTDALYEFNYVINDEWHEYKITTTIDSATLFVDDIEIETINNITFYDIPNAGNSANIGGHGAHSTNGLFSNFYINSAFEYRFQTGQGSTVFDISGNSSVGTITGANLDTFWGTKSNYASPERYIRGFNKTLVTEVAGTTVTLANPDGSNVGDETAVNGDFAVTTGWTKSTGVTISNNECVFTAVASGQSVRQTNLSTTPGSIFQVDFEVIELTAGAFNITMNGVINSGAIIGTVGKHRQFITAPAISSNTFGVHAVNTTTGKIDNISVKEVTAIPALGEYTLDIKPNDTYIHILNTAADATGNGYTVRTPTGALGLYRNDAGVLTELDSNAVTVTDNDTLKVNIKVDGIDVYINDVLELTSTDGTYTEGNFIVLHSGVNAEVNKLYKDGVSYDVSKFIDGTGTYGVRYDLGDGDGIKDIRGKLLQYAPNCITPSEELLQQKDNATLNVMYNANPGLGFMLNPNWWGHLELSNLDTAGILETDFRMNKSDDNTTINFMLSIEQNP